jgi:hypothetical protein
MTTEHDLTKQVRDEIQRRKREGEPIHGRKIHGSLYMRDHPDWNISYRGLSVIIETKPRAGGHPVTAGQASELRKFQQAGSLCAVCRTIAEVRAVLDRVKQEAQRLPSWANEPPLTVPEWMNA